MKTGKLIGGLSIFVLLLVVIILLIGQFLGQPILFGFVVTGSMSPTLEAGDGFVAVPPSLAGDIEEGDVITFDAEELQGGGLTTHRVVEVTDEGYITQGDANPFTDQDGPEPPVTDAQVASVAYQWNSEVIRLPHLGTVFMGIQGLLAGAAGIFGSIPILRNMEGFGIGNLFVGAGIILLAYSFISDLGSNRNSRSRSRSRSRGYMKAGLVLGLILLFIVVPMNVSILMQSGAIGMDVVSSSSPSENPNVIERGTTEERVYQIPNNGFIPFVSVIEPGSSGVEIEQSVFALAPGEEAEASVFVTAPEETGYYVRYLDQWTYPHLLPANVIVSLHHVHPFVAMLALNGVVVSLVVLVFALSVGFSPVRMESRARDVPLKMKLQRLLNRWL